jgi:alginate O-acetyltransferase complex protein AlgI
VPLSGAPYFVFLAAIFLLYWTLARVRLLGLAVLLLANYFFYARWGMQYLYLIPAASTCDFLIGLGLQRFRYPVARRVLVALSLTLNLGILVWFKWNPATLALSFYVLQSLTYTLDLYKGYGKGTSSYLAHLTAVSFFPTVVAGPITRVCELLAQLERRFMPVAPAESGRAIFLIGLGLIKKLLIADCLAQNLVDRVFDLPRLYTGFETLIAVYGYALQLYYDFSGYTDIAIGSALLLGLKLPENFNMPYAAVSVADFWRRWHMSFSNWLRDYLYFSLPGLRSRLKIFTWFNLTLTMFLGGLWHGLTWNFAIWGLLHGAALAATSAWQTWRGRSAVSNHWWTRPAKAFLTAQFVCFTWIFFRAPNLIDARAILGRIGSLTFSTDSISPMIAGVMALGLAGHYFPKNWFHRAQEWFSLVPFYAQAAAVTGVVVTIELMMGHGSEPFVYSRF